MNDFFIISLWASIGIALLAGPLGCLMVFKRVACLGDTLSHGSVLGLSLGLLVGVHPMIALTAVTCVWVSFLWILNKNETVSTDAAMALLTQSSLAVSILFFYFVPFQETSLIEALVGNILTVGKEDIFLIYAMDFVFAVLLFFFWKKWILIAIHPDLAFAKHIQVPLLQILFLIMVGLFIAFSIQMMGALLVPAFLIIPAVAARLFSKTPEQMAFLASVIALCSALSGLGISYQFDIPTGPTMVCMTVLFYTFLSLFKQLLRIKQVCLFKNWKERKK